MKVIAELYVENDRLERENNQLKKMVNHKHKYCSEMEGKYILEKFKLDQLRSWLEDKIHNIVPEGCGINYNCEYDSEEDYVRAMEERSSLHTLKDTLDKLNELEGGKNE